MDQISTVDRTTNIHMNWEVFFCIIFEEVLFRISSYLYTISYHQYVWKSNGGHGEGICHLFIILKSNLQQECICVMKSLFKLILEKEKLHLFIQLYTKFEEIHSLVFLRNINLKKKNSSLKFLIPCDNYLRIMYYSGRKE